MAKNNNLTDFLRGVADAIRAKKGTSAPINPQDFESEIASIEGGGGGSKIGGIFDTSLAPKQITASDLEGVETIRDYAMYYNSNYSGRPTYIEFPNSLKKIGNNAFSGSNLYAKNNQVDGIWFPDSLEEIGHQAFYGTPTYSFHIGKNIKSIGSNALNAGRNSVNNYWIYIDAQTPPAIYTSSLYNRTRLRRIVVPKGCGDVYRNATNWSSYADLIVEAEE